jgi:hypothetical protein
MKLVFLWEYVRDILILFMNMNVVVTYRYLLSWCQDINTLLISFVFFLELFLISECIILSCNKAYREFDCKKKNYDDEDVLDWQLFTHLRIILRILSLGSAVIVQWRQVIRSSLAVLNAHPNPYFAQHKTAKHESISQLPSSVFVQNEYFSKVTCINFNSFVICKQRFFSVIFYLFSCTKFVLVQLYYTSV